MGLMSHIWGLTDMSLLQFFSVTLIHFSDQNLNSQYLFSLHIIVALVHIKKAISHLFEQVANALVHPNDYVQLSAVSYIINCLCHVDQNVL